MDVTDSSRAINDRLVFTSCPKASLNSFSITDWGTVICVSEEHLKKDDRTLTTLDGIVILVSDGQ